MTNRSNELFEIIKSLNPQEKTFFKGYFLKTKDEHTPSFLILFDAINELANYDAQQLKQLLAKKGFRSNYFKAQTYLTEAILTALTQYHSETENSIKIGHLIQQVNILIKKNLFRTAQKYFDRAQKMLDTHTMYEYQSLLDYLRFNFHEKSQVWMDGYMRDVRTHLKNFELETELRKAGSDSLILAIEHYDKQVPEEDIREPAAGILDSLDRISKNLRLNNFSKSRFYSTKIQCLMMLKKEKQLAQAITEYSRFLRGLPATTAFFARTVLHGLNSIVIALAHLRNFQQIEKTASYAEQYFHSLPKKICTPDICSLYYSYILENMLAIYNETGQPEKTIDTWDKNKKEILQYDKKNSTSLYTMNIALGEFMRDDFHRAVRLANTIPHDPVRPTVQCEAKLLLVLAHYELENLDILPSLARQARRAYEKCGMLKKADMIFLDFFEKKAGKLFSRQEKAKAFTDLQDILDRHALSETHPATGSIDVALWLESKISGRGYVELIRKKAG